MKILFVCMGNICRSPAGEGVLRHKLKDAGLDSAVSVDSAGTINFHAGKPPDSRMRAAARNRGIELVHHARQVTAEDLQKFDLVLVADRENLRDVMELPGAEKAASKIRLFCEFCSAHDEPEVPDPYYGGPAGFELVLDLLEDGCDGIVRRIRHGESLTE